MIELKPIIDAIFSVFELATKYHLHLGAILCAVTFALTYLVKWSYKVCVKERLTANMIRGISLFCGIWAAFIAWPDASPMPWYVAGLLAGPGSILVYDVLANTLGVKWPWFGALLRGYRL